MRFGSVAVAGLLGLATPVFAQGLPAEYAQAFADFTLPGMQGLDPDAAAAAVRAILPQLEGDWMRADHLTADSPILDLGILVQACARIKERFVITSLHGFEMQRIGPDNEIRLRTRHDYIGLNNFQRSFDENEWLAYLGFGEELAPPASIYFGPPRGDVALFVPSPNIMVFKESRGSTQIYARCP